MKDALIPPSPLLHGCTGCLDVTCWEYSVVDRRRNARIWIVALVGALALVTGRPVHARAASEHCAGVPHRAGHATQHSQTPTPFCQQSLPCSDCGTMPCRSGVSCTGFVLSALSACGQNALAEPDAVARLGSWTPRILTRSTSPPVPPPIPLL